MSENGEESPMRSGEKITASHTDKDKIVSEHEEIRRSAISEIFDILIQQHDYLFQHVLALESEGENGNSFPKKLLECLESDLELIGKTPICPKQGDKAKVEQMELIANTPPEDANGRPFYFQKSGNPGLFYSVPGTVAKVHGCGWLSEDSRTHEVSVYRKAKVMIYDKTKLEDRDNFFGRANRTSPEE